MILTTFQHEEESDLDKFLVAVAKKHGENKGSCFAVSMGCLGFLGWGLFNIGGLVICFMIVADSARYISSEIAFLTLFGTLAVELIFLVGLFYYGSDIMFFSIRDIIAVLAFIQTLFWVIDSAKPIHEPRSVLLLVISAWLAYYSEQISLFGKRFPDILNKIKPKAAIPQEPLPFEGDIIVDRENT